MHFNRDSKGRFAKKNNRNNIQCENNNRYMIRDGKGRFAKKIATYTTSNLWGETYERAYYNVRDTKGRFMRVGQ